MANKTNKAYSKRINVTKNGKLKVRANNRCHYNSQERNPRKMAKKKFLSLILPAKIKRMMMPHHDR